MSINETLVQRQSTHGNFELGAVLSQSFCRVMRSAKNYDELTDAQVEALEMILHKVARILNGNPDFAEHWHDIGGYAKLAERLCPDYKEA